VLAVATWLVASPVAAEIPKVLHVDPFLQQGGMVPLALGAVLVAAVGGVAAWRRGPWTAGVAAGLFAAFIVLTLRSALHGTPFPPEGIDGDTGRLAALANKYAVHWGPVDGIVSGVPGQYPPLFPWLIGKTAAVTGVPAWRLIAPAEILTVSGAVIAAFLFWLRLTGAGAALAIAALVTVVAGAPYKAYEFIALAVTIPWVLVTIGNPPRGRPHWLPAGVIGGLLVLDYYAYLGFAAPGMLALAYVTWRTAAGRRDYVVYLLRVALTAALVASWFLIPYLIGTLAGGRQVLDLYESTAVADNALPFLDVSPIGLAELIGLAGLVWFRRTRWWANPLLLVVIGAYAYRAAYMVRYVLSGHTGLYYYTTALVEACLITGCVLSVLELPALLAERFAPRRAGLVVITITLAFAGFAYWSDWMPAHTWRADRTDKSVAIFHKNGYTNDLTLRAHLQPFPDGHRPAFAKQTAASERRRYPWTPVEPIRRAVQNVLGPDATPHTLSYSQQVFSFLTWPGFIPVDRCAALTPVNWDARARQVVGLTRISDPDAFAAASKSTPFGPIDVFVLRQEGDHFTWRADCSPVTARFQPGQFSTFQVITGLPDHAIVAVRLPPGTRPHPVQPPTPSPSPTRTSHHVRPSRTPKARSSG
jgi:Arabinofuranosyltransferase N terminal